MIILWENTGVFSKCSFQLMGILCLFKINHSSLLSLNMLVLVCKQADTFWPVSYDAHFIQEGKYDILSPLNSSSGEEEVLESSGPDKLNQSTTEGRLHMRENISTATKHPFKKRDVTKHPFKKRDVTVIYYDEYFGGDESQGSFSELRVSIKNETGHQNPIIKHSAKAESNSSREDEEEYDYHKFREEYYDQLAKNLVSNVTIIPPEETTDVIGAIKNVISLQEPKNCTAEEMNNIGIRALKCMWKHYKTAKDRKEISQLFKRLLRIILIWFLIYVSIAVPCWCQKGWCCCCISRFFPFCQPYRRLNEMKTYLAKNPPGIVLDKKGKEVYYDPSEDEIEQYNHLMYSMRRI